MDNLDNLDKIKSYFSRGDNERSTSPGKRRRRQEPGHGDEDQRHNNYNVFHSAYSTPPGKKRRSLDMKIMEAPVITKCCSL